MVAQIDSHYIRTRPTRLWSRLLSYGLFEGRPLTTKGQWINPLVFSLFAMERRLPQLKRAEAPIFILGAGRSGTTILGLLLSMHGKVGFLNEPKAMWHAALGGGEDLIGSYDRGPGRYRLDAGDATPDVVRAMHRIHGAYLRATGTSRVVDKYPELVFRLPFVREIFPDAKFLFISRNGWDTCGSIEGWSDRLGVQSGDEIHDWWGADGRKWQLLVDQLVPEHPDLAPHAGEMRDWQAQTQRAVVEWIVTMREGVRHTQEAPETILHIPYEALCEDPSGWMGRIAAFCDLPADETFLTYAGQKLSTVAPRPAFPLEPCLEEAFATTMQMLGYKDVAA
ncbi:sulfotransferase [Tropicimonas sp. TH_r6]|uniref:sulfotransferase family protein n=1 Tax=Tropicimonas sp. TH_r6 TaxID=3082085 RepID=UPI0029551C2D|nr:sulfotransferase [Tropicimonas sp. TH_r6]MDV7142072.1 sulfotransferase [Tropicimonas sp. TH_r6]